MSLKENIRSLILTATKMKQESAKNVLKVVLGEIELQESRMKKDAIPDEEIYKIIRKTLQGIDEMIGYKPTDEGLKIEKKTLDDLMPKQLNCADLALNLTCKAEELRAAKSDGQATGIAMKFLKEGKHLVDGAEVAKVVKTIRETKNT
jgi:uncharacterized protein